jgi:predicted nucleic-acid-binding protein
MIGLDTNILVRFLVQDDPAQTLKAAAVLSKRVSERSPGFVSAVTMAETAWVLERAYRLDDAGIAAAVELLLSADNLVFEREPEIYEASAAVKDGQATFADALIAAIGRTEGCDVTLTFDRKAARLPGFELV